MLSGPIRIDRVCPTQFGDPSCVTDASVSVSNHSFYSTSVLPALGNKLFQKESEFIRCNRYLRVRYALSGGGADLIFTESAEADSV